MYKRFIELKKESILYRINPALKIIFMFIIMLLTIIFNSPLPLGILFISLILLSLSGGAITNLKKILPLVIILMLFTIILWNIILKGKTQPFYIYNYPIFMDVFLYSIGMSLRVSTVIVAGVILLSTTSNEDLNYGFRKIQIPQRVTFALVYSLMLLPALFETISVVQMAQRARGYTIRGRGPISRIKKYIPLIIPTILYLLKNANHISMALESKAFGYSKHPIFIKEYKITPLDIILISVSIFITIMALYLRILGYGVVFHRL